ncbi:MAG TPA: DMT family transporter [Planctomycetota bacterium]|nr:DMT family transporter [Planctomycetota bacterium]
MSSALGIGAALGAAFVWALTSPMLAEPVRRYGATAVNLYKSTVSAALFIAAACALLGPGAFARAADAAPWFALSGAVGLAVGDTAYFVSLARLGPTVSLILYQSSTVFGVALGMLFRGERPGAAQLAGTVAIVAGVLVATLERRGADRAGLDADARARRRERAIGVLGGLTSALCQAVGLLVNSRAFDVAKEAGFERAAISTAPVAGALRMTAAAVGLVLVAALAGRGADAVRPLRERAGWRMTFVPTVLSAFLGIFSMQVAVANLEVGLVSTLLATSPIFAIPAEWALSGVRPTLRKTAGAVLGAAGVALVSLA